MTVAAQYPVVEVWDRPACQSGATRLGYLEGGVELEGRRGVDRDEWALVKCGAEQAGAVLFAPRRVVRFTFASGTGDEAYEEWRIAGAKAVETVVTPTERFLTVRAQGLHTDLGAAGPMRRTVSGLPSYEFTDSKTVSAWIDEIVTWLSTQGYGYISKGTVDFTSTETISLNFTTAQELMNTLETRTRGEWQLRRNGGTDYKIDLVTRIGSAATAVRFVEGQNLQILNVSDNEVDLATELVPVTSRGVTDEGKGIARTGWKIDAINGGTSRVTIIDPAEVSGVEMIGEDDQFNGDVMVCLRSARPYTVVDTFVSSQELQLDDVSGLAVGDYLERFVSTAQDVKADYDWVTGISPTTTAVYLPRISGVSSDDLTIVNMFNSTDPVQVDNWEHGLKVRSSPLQHTNTVTNRNATTRELTLGTTTSAIQAGDIGFCHTGASEPYTRQTEIFEVESVTDGTHIIVKKRHNYNTTAVFTGTGAVAWNIRIYRPRAGTTFVISSTASSNTVTVADASGAGIATSDVLEGWIETGGVLASTLESPAALSAYTKPKVLYYRRDDLGGDRNLWAGNNPWFRTWTGGGSAMPDDWAFNGTGTISQQTAASTGGLYGPYVLRIVPSTNSTQIRSVSPTLRVRPALLTDRLGIVAKARCRFVTSPGGAGYLDFVLHQYQPTGAYITNPNWLASGRIKPTGGSATGGTEVAVGTWAEITIIVTDLPALRNYEALRWGFGPGFFMSNGGFAESYEFDAVSLYYGIIDPTDFLEYDDSTALWSKANEYLQTYRTVPQVISVEILDLYQADRTRFSGKRLQKGGDVIIYSATAGVDTTVRSMSIQTNYRQRTLSQCSVNTIQETLSRQLASGAI